MHGKMMPEKMAFPTNDYQAAQYMQAMAEPVEDRQTAVSRVLGTYYQARELSEEIWQIAEMLLGPSPPMNLTSDQKGSPVRMPGILNDLDEASEDTRRQMERAFAAIKRLRAAF